MGHVSPILTVTGFRPRLDDGSETTATWNGALDTNFGVTPDTTFRLRLIAAETNNAAAANEDLQWQYNHNGGGWNNITTTSSVVRAVSSANFTDATSSTQQIGVGTFVTPNDGMTQDGLAGGGNLDYSGNDETETECSLQVLSADTSTNDTIEIRVTFDGVAPGGTPTLPTITVGAARNVTQNRGGAGDLTTITMSASSTVTKVIKRNVPCSTVTLEQAFGGFGTTEITTHDLDGTTRTGSWTNATNANDGSTSTYAQGSSNSLGRWNGIEGWSTTGDENVARIRGRAYVSTDDPTFDRIEFIWDTGSYGNAKDHPTIGGAPREGGTTPAWTSWYDMNPIWYNDDTRKDTPFPRVDVDDIGIIIVGGIPSTDNRLYTAQYEITTGQIITGYFDTTPTDSDGHWSNEANSVDGSTSTSTTGTLTTGGGSAFTTGVLSFSGHNAASVPGSSEIYNVAVRVYHDHDVNISTYLRALDGSDVLMGLGNAWVSQSNGLGNNPLWSNWTQLTTPTGGWTQSKIDNLEIQIARSTQTGTASINKVEIAIFHEDFNPQGSIVTKTLGRAVTCGTEALTFTENQATVPLDFTIDMTCRAEQLELVTNDATVERPLAVVGKTSKKKQWKALPWSEWYLDGHTGINGSHDAATIGNALDKDLATSYDPVSNQWPWIQGTEPLSPQSSPTAVPVAIKVRYYISGTPGAWTSVWAGWNYDNNGLNISPRYETEYLGTADVTGSGSGNWSEWLDFNLAYNNWDDAGATDVTSPYTWQAIEDKFITGHYLDGGGNWYVHAVQIMVQEAEPANLISGYVDASEGWNDYFGVWTAQSNAWDGSTTTFAATEFGGATSWGLNGTENRFVVAGNTLAQGAAEDEVLSVWFRARMRGQYNPATEGDELSCILYPYHPDYPNTGTGVKFPVYNPDSPTAYSNQRFAGPNDTDNSALWDFPATTNTAFWTPWYKIDFENLDPDADGRNWKSWTEIQKMGFELFRGVDADGASLEIAKVEFVALGEPPNSNRGGGKVKKDRGVNCATEVITQASNQATVTTGSTNRNVDCTTEVLTLTENASTANAERGVSGGTEVLSLADNDATVGRGRGVLSATEAVNFSESASTINITRGVDSATEVLSFAETQSNIGLERGVSGVTQALVFTEESSTVNPTRGVVGATEAVLMTEQDSTVNRERGVTGATEVVVMTENQASISTSENLDVTCTTEAITFTENAANVNGERISAAPVELMALAENASAINRTRDVTCGTEVLSFADNDSVVNPTRSVLGDTEVLTLTENAATIAANRAVISATETITMTENASVVNTSRPVLATTEVVTLTDNDSNINATRHALGATEVVTMTEGTSDVDRQRGVNAGTEAISLTESTAQVALGQNLDVICSTEAITLTENASSINRERGVASNTEVMLATEGAANVARDRVFATGTEVVTFVESAADTNVSRNALGVTETLTLADNDATVVRDRVFTTNTEVITVTENQATVDTSASNNPRDVTCTTETISLTETAANVNGLRIVGSAVELLAIAESASAINRTRDVASLTEALILTEAGAVNSSRTVQSLTDQLVMTESAANVSTSTNRIVTGTTSLLSLAESAALVNAVRNVAGATEQLNVVSTGSVTRLRNVTGVTENVTMENAGANIARSRGIVGVTEVLTLTEAAANVFRGANLDITGTTAALLLASNAATVASGRAVSAQTEELTLTENAASLSITRGVIGNTEVILMAGTLAQITRERSGAVPGSIIYAHPDPEAYVLMDGRMIQL